MEETKKAIECMYGRLQLISKELHEFKLASCFGDETRKRDIVKHLKIYNQEIAEKIAVLEASNGDGK